MHTRSIVTISCIVILTITTTYSQGKYTIYDKLPGVPISYKPAMEASYPAWGKMLYTHDINVHVLDREFEEWESKKTGEFRPLRKYYKLWRRAVAPYVTKDGTIQMPEPSSPQLSQNKNPLLKTAAECTETDDRRWQFVGPKETNWTINNQTTPRRAASYQVNVYSLDVARSHPNILYCGTETGYVNKTTDKGLTWRPLALDYIFGGGIKAVAIDPLDPDIVLVSAGNQIHKTTDGGVNWRSVASFGTNRAPERLEIDITQPTRIIASSYDGLFLSVDGGESWVKKWDLPTLDAHFIEGGRIYGISEAPPTQGSAGRVTICISEDNGDTFRVDNTFPNNVNNIAGMLLAVKENAPQQIFALVLEADNTPQLFSKNLAANTWRRVATGNTDEFRMNNGQGYYDMVLEVDPNDEQTLYAGTTTLFISRNGGQTWQALGGYFGAFRLHPDMQDMVIMNDGDTWVATDGGITLSRDHFRIEQNIFDLNNGCLGSDMWGFDMGWNEDVIVGGRYHNGNTVLGEAYDRSALYLGGAESPTGWILTGKRRQAVFDDLGGGRILPDDQDSPFEDRFVFSLQPNMDEFGGRRSNLVQHPWYYEQIYLGQGNGFWMSKDNGATFELLHDFGSRIRYFEVSHKNPSVIYTDVIAQGLWRSIDGGLTWTALTSEPYLNSQGGSLYITISPNDENRIYACFQNGTWSSTEGRIFSSADGGDTWQEITGSLNVFTKMLVVQPDQNGEDIIYLFANSGVNQNAEVYVKKSSEDFWTEYNCDLPANFRFIFAQAFYRDSKLRIAGNAGIWEAPLLQSDYRPLLAPWISSSEISCATDTIQLEDHSIIDHEDAQWQWNITPAPTYISDPTMRNPQVVFGQEGSYEISLSIHKGGKQYNTTLPEMILVKSCPSIQDCDNPDLIPTDNMSILFANSEETLFDEGYATHAIDGDINTIWHTAYVFNQDTYPHELQIDLGDRYELSNFVYQPRTQGVNGTIKGYELYLSDDVQMWGNSIAQGDFETNTLKKVVSLDKPQGRYLRFRALSEINNNIWASAAEIEVRGCLKDLSTSVSPDIKKSILRAFPVPSRGPFTLPLPYAGQYSYTLHDMQGTILISGMTDKNIETFDIDLSTIPSGIYLLSLTTDNRTKYIAKLVRTE